MKDLLAQFTFVRSAPGSEEGMQKTFVESLINSPTRQIFVEHLSVPGTILCPKGISANRTNTNSYPSKGYVLVKRERQTKSIINKKNHMLESDKHYEK